MPTHDTAKLLRVFLDSSLTKWKDAFGVAGNVMRCRAGRILDKERERGESRMDAARRLLAATEKPATLSKRLAVAAERLKAQRTKDYIEVPDDDEPDAEADDLEDEIEIKPARRERQKRPITESLTSGTGISFAQEERIAQKVLAKLNGHNADTSAQSVQSAKQNEHIQEESAVLLISDWHLGKKTPNYDYQKALDALQRASYSVQRTSSLLSGHYKITDLHIMFLGDIVDGAGIYPTQAHHVDLGIREQTKIAAQHLYTDLIAPLSKMFPKVYLDGVAGNHGRTSKHNRETDNIDLLLYDELAYRSKEYANVKALFEDDPFLKIVKIRGHKWCLNHFSTIQMYQNIPWYGLTQRALRWQKGLGDFAVLAGGHFHICGYFQPGPHIYLNGTAVLDDRWAIESFGYPSGNTWWFVGVSNKRAKTWQFGIDLKP